MNPYEVLGIPETASEAQIKSAYRRRARETHPDHGGDGAEFSLVSQAQAILMDPAARARFDETGSIDEVAPLTVRQRMIQIIAAMFGQALEVEGKQGTDLKSFDLLKAMRAQVAQNTSAVKANHAKFTKAVNDRKFLLKRITRKDDGENLFADIIRQQLVELEKVQKQADIDMRAMQMAADELLHYENEVDLIQAVQMMQWGGSFTNSSTAGNLWGFQ